MKGKSNQEGFSKQLRVFAETLGTEKYYVYMLCKKNENGEPFYVGKGCGDRICQHEDYAEMAQVSIKSDDTLTEEEKKGKINQLSEKLKQCLDDSELVIVKWGLTANEALMCESALINCLKFCGKKLTNLVNGHATKAEKASRADVPTKARTLEAFSRECTHEEKDVSGIGDATAAFIKINESYPRCITLDGKVDEDRVKDYTRAIWNMKKESAKKIQYLFAQYKGRVVGIYRVTRVSKPIIEEWKETGTLKDFPGNVVDEFEKINEWFPQFANFENPLKEAKTGLNETDFEAFKKCHKRIYFSVEDTKDFSEFKNCILVDGGKLLKGQNPVQYYNIK